MLSLLAMKYSWDHQYHDAQAMKLFHHPWGECRTHAHDKPGNIGRPDLQHRGLYRIIGFYRSRLASYLQAEHGQ
jgi:hypothetical protein